MHRFCWTIPFPEVLEVPIAPIYMKVPTADTRRRVPAPLPGLPAAPPASTPLGVPMAAPPPRPTPRNTVPVAKEYCSTIRGSLVEPSAVVGEVVAREDQARSRISMATEFLVRSIRSAGVRQHKQTRTRGVYYLKQRQFLTIPAIEPIAQQNIISGLLVLAVRYDVHQRSADV